MMNIQRKQPTFIYKRKESIIKKKFVSILLASVTILSLTGCGQVASTVSSDTKITTTTIQTVSSSDTAESVVSSVEEEKEIETVELSNENNHQDIPESFDYSMDISINPHITFYIRNNQVIAWVFNNEDAKNAFGDIDFEGIYPHKAVEKVIDACIEQKYLKEGGTVSINYEEGECEVPNGSIVEVEETVESIVNRDALKFILEMDEKNKVEKADETPKNQVSAEKPNGETESRPANQKSDESASNSSSGKNTPSPEQAPAKTPSQPAAHVHSSEGREVSCGYNPKNGSACELLSQSWYTCSCGETVVTTFGTLEYHSLSYDDLTTISTEIVVENGLVVEVNLKQYTHASCHVCGWSGECSGTITTYNNTGLTYDQYTGNNTPAPETPSPEPETPAPEPAPETPAPEPVPETPAPEPVPETPAPEAPAAQE